MVRKIDIVVSQQVRIHTAGEIIIKEPRSVNSWKMSTHYDKVSRTDEGKEQANKQDPRMSIIYPYADAQDVKKQSNDPSGRNNSLVSAEDGASFLSVMLLSFLSPLFKIGHQRVFSNLHIFRNLNFTLMSSF